METGRTVQAAIIGLGRCGLSHNGSHFLALVAYLAGADAGGATR